MELAAVGVTGIYFYNTDFWLPCYLACDGGAHGAAGDPPSVCGREGLADAIVLGGYLRIRHHFAVCAGPLAGAPVVYGDRMRVRYRNCVSVHSAGMSVGRTKEQY